MFQIADRPLRLHAIVVVVEECRERESQRHLNHRRWRLEARNQSNQIIQQNENTNAGDVRLERLVMVTNDLLSLSADKFVDHFSQLLRGIWLLYRERHPDKDEKCNHQGGDQEFHCKRAVDRRGIGNSLRIAGSQRLKKPDLYALQKAIY